LRATAPGAPTSDDTNDPHAAFGWSAVRPLLVRLAVLLLLTPLGILAVGSAWGEWSPRDLAAVSAHREPPARVPPGLERLSSVWTAPFPAYAPPFLRSASFGYLLSAAFGSGLILLMAAAGDRVLSGRQRSG
jgi:cobalt/nickel transport system permease protein